MCWSSTECFVLAGGDGCEAGGGGGGTSKLGVQEEENARRRTLVRVKVKALRQDVLQAPPEYA